MSYTLICPPKAETESTGFVGGMEKTYRGKNYRAELYRSGWSIACNGEKLRRWDDLPLPVQKAALDAKRILLEAAA